MAELSDFIAVLSLDVLEPLAAMIAHMDAVHHHDSSRVNAKPLGVLLRETAPVVTAVGGLEPGAATAAERRARIRGALAGGFVGLTAHGGLGEFLKVSDVQGHHAAAGHVAIDPGTHSRDDAAHDAGLGGVLNQVGELLFAAHLRRSVIRHGALGSDCVLVARGDEPVDVVEHIGVEIRAEHVLKPDMDAYFVEHHTTGLIHANIIGDHVNRTIRHCHALGVVRMDARQLVDRLHDTDTTELEKFVGGLAEAAAKSTRQIIDGRTDLGGAGGRTRLTTGAEGRIVTDDMARVRDSGCVDRVQERDF